MSGEEFKQIMNIKVGKKMQENAYLMIEKEGILADSIRYFWDYVWVKYQEDKINRLDYPILLLDWIPWPKIFKLSMNHQCCPTKEKPVSKEGGVNGKPMLSMLDTHLHYFT